MFILYCNTESSYTLQSTRIVISEQASNKAAQSLCSYFYT